MSDSEGLELKDHSFIHSFITMPDILRENVSLYSSVLLGNCYGRKVHDIFELFLIFYHSSVHSTFINYIVGVASLKDTTRQSLTLSFSLGNSVTEK